MDITVDWKEQDQFPKLKVTDENTMIVFTVYSPIDRRQLAKDLRLAADDLEADL